MADREPPRPTAEDGAGARRLFAIASPLTLIAVWHLAASLVASPDLPGPLAVARFLVHVAANGDLAHQLGATLARVAAAFAITMVVGTAIGVWLGRSRRADLLFDGWLIVALNLPALLVAVLAYVWLGLTDLAAVIAVALNKIPSVAITLREGARALDPDLDRMATVFRLSPLARLRHVVAPALAPFVAAAARNGLALVWKIVLFVELLGRPNGIGHAVHTAFQLYDLTAVIGWSLAFVIVVLVIEHAVMEPFERHASRWRRL
jgi:NitT/TauT family transport system permease protein